LKRDPVAFFKDSKVLSSFIKKVIL